jgi:hypothetical protein
MKLFWILPFLIFQQEVPFKPNDEFSVEINYTFKQRPSAVNTVEFKDGRQVSDKNSGPLPHLALKLKYLKASEDEVKLKAINSHDQIIISRKIQVGQIVDIQMGFMDDIKDRVGASTHELNVFSLSSKKKELNRIHLLIMEDGTFLVNGEKRGKF